MPENNAGMVASGLFTLCFENECCSIGNDSSIPALVFSWKGILPSPAFREVHQKALQQIRLHKFTKILGDATHMKTMGSEDMAWLVDYWIPSAIEAGLKYNAIVESTNTFNRMTVNAVVEKVYPGQVDYNYFSNYEAARFWLKNC